MHPLRVLIVISLFFSLFPSCCMENLPDELVFKILSETHEQQPLSSAKTQVPRYMRYTLVCRGWRTIILGQLVNIVKMCAQDEKNRFLFRAVAQQVPSQVLDILLQAHAAIHGFIKIPALLPTYDFPGGPLLEYQKEDVNTSSWFYSVEQGHIDIVAYFITRKTDIDAQQEGTLQTALMKACQKNNSKLVELLLQHGADVALCCAANKTAKNYAKDQKVRDLLGKYQQERRVSEDTDVSSSEESQADSQHSPRELIICDDTDLEPEIYGYVSDVLGDEIIIELRDRQGNVYGSQSF